MCFRRLWLCTIFCINENNRMDSGLVLFFLPSYDLPSLPPSAVDAAEVATVIAIAAIKSRIHHLIIKKR